MYQINSKVFNSFSTILLANRIKITDIHGKPMNVKR